MISPTMAWASHHCTLGAGVGATGTGAAVVALDWTKLSRLGLHFLSALGKHRNLNVLSPRGGSEQDTCLDLLGLLVMADQVTYMT